MKIAVIMAINGTFQVLNVCVLISVLSTWIPFLYQNAFFAKLLDIINMIIEPIMSLSRKLMEKVSFGGDMPLDFSPIIALLLLQVLNRVLIVILAAVL